ADIHRFPDGTVDAVTTLQTFVDSGAAYGLNYGAFIGAPITQDLAPYISGRVNDDTFESHRVELFPLPKADNQAKVKFRFMQAATGSWYWGVDDFGIYSIPPISPPPGPTLSITRTGTGLSITFTGTLQSADDVTGPFTDVAGATSPFAITPNANHKFYRSI